MSYNHQSSSSSLSLDIALCLALKASAKPPARLGVGVLRPLSPPLPLAPILIPESLGAEGGAGFLPAATGRFAGGAGGLGLALARAAAPLTPLGFAGAAGGGGGTCRTTGGGASSWRYAEGAQPSVPLGVLG